MTSILALATLGAWNYSGFLAEAGPIQDRPILPPAMSRTAEPLEAPASTIPPPARPTVAAAPTLHRLLDARGQAWEHADPAYLRRFVRDRDASFATYTQPAARCAGGRCR